jgi:hypothetical protein
MPGQYSPKVDPAGNTIKGIKFNSPKTIDFAQKIIRKMKVARTFPSTTVVSANLPHQSGLKQDNLDHETSRLLAWGLSNNAWLVYSCKYSMG